MVLRALLGIALVACIAHAAPRSFVISGDQFLKDGQPFQVISGSVHYFRWHPSKYADVLQKAKACGLNTVQTYISWLRHEPKPGQVNLTDLTSFLDAVQAAGLLVFLRLGPYICAEYDFGGMPGWLLEDGTSSIVMRSADPVFLSAVDRWFSVLLPALKPYLYSNGGPIISAQIDNEHGYYSNGGPATQAYLSHLADAYRTAWGPDAVIIHSTDSANQTLLYGGGYTPAVFSTVDFGPGPSLSAAGAFAIQDQANARPGGIGAGLHLNSEYYVGGENTNWGDPPYHNDTPAAINASIAYYSTILASGASSNVYMFAGGTNRGWEAGLHADGSAHWQTGPYVPGAPLSEAGDPTDLYQPFCAAIAAHTGQPAPVPPPIAPKSHYMGQLAMQQYVRLWDAVPSLLAAAGEASAASFKPLTAEAMHLQGGYMLYSTTTQVDIHSDNSNLYIRELRDRAYVYLNRSTLLSVQQRNLSDAWPPAQPQPQTAQPNLVNPYTTQLDVLVENMGRDCFGPWYGQDVKGLSAGLQLGPYQQPYLFGWTSTPLSFINASLVALAPVLQPIPVTFNASQPQPTVYAATFTIDQGSTPQLVDTFLDMRGWGKGIVLLNGYHLGRFWYLGPEYSLYVPAALLRYGVNEVLVFEADGVGAGCSATVPGEPGPESWQQYQHWLHQREATIQSADMEDSAAALEAGHTLPLHAREDLRRRQVPQRPPFPIRHPYACYRQSQANNNSSSGMGSGLGAPSITFREVPVRDLPQGEQ